MKRLVAVLCVLLFTSASARDGKAIREFKKLYPCPATQQASGPCPGWIIDHVIAIACGGPDSPANMQWQTVEEAKAKDRWEIKDCRK